MNYGLPQWYASLNTNEKRIVDIYIETRGQLVFPRPYLETRLVKTGLMSTRILTERLRYLIEDKGFMGKIEGKNGAVFYAPKLIIDTILSGLAPGVAIAIDTASPKSSTSFSMPKKLIREIVSEEGMYKLHFRSALDWEKFGVGSEREKEEVYRRIRQLMKRRRGSVGSKHAWKETEDEQMLRRMTEKDESGVVSNKVRWNESRKKKAVDDQEDINTV